MSHSYEEIRSAACDVLAGRSPNSYGNEQYVHFKIGVGALLRFEDGSPIPPSLYAGAAALDAGDANIFLEVFWDLFRDGIITLGLNDANPEFPFFRLTQRGRSVIAEESGYFFHDVAGFEKQVRAKIPGIDETTLLYLKESLQALRSGCLLSSAVMLGVATEHTFLLMLEAIAQNPIHAGQFLAAQEERSFLKKLTKFKSAFDAKKNVPREVLNDFETQFLGILSLIRAFRNESGHPSGEFINREQAFTNLQLFISYGRKAYQLIEYYSKPD